jgi:3-hydroxybutyryl-CoA dehydrogenase
MLETIKEISVIGAGIMGHGIAQSFLMGGYPVRLYDIRGGALEDAKSRIGQSLELFREEGLIRRADIKKLIPNLVLTSDLGQAVKGADFLVEAAPEELELKQNLFRKIEPLCSPKTILASNTSSLTLDKIARGVKNKKRLVITHWFNPPQIIPVIEVVGGLATSRRTLLATCRLLEAIRKVPVLLSKEIPGFLVNRIQMAMLREILDLYEKRIAGPSAIDEAVRGSLGFRLAVVGPLRTVDLGGADTWLKSSKNLFPKINSSRVPPRALCSMVSRGHTGIKSGRGFFNYGEGSSGAISEEIRKRDRSLLGLLRNWRDSI